MTIVSRVLRYHIIVNRAPPLLCARDVHHAPILSERENVITYAIEMTILSFISSVETP